jgi:hypothetical protein
MRGSRRPRSFSGPSVGRTRLHTHRLQLPIQMLMQTKVIRVLLPRRQAGAATDAGRGLPLALIRTGAVRVESNLEAQFNQLLGPVCFHGSRAEIGWPPVRDCHSSFEREGAGAGFGPERKVDWVAWAWMETWLQAGAMPGVLISNVFRCAKRLPAAQDAFRTTT